MPVVAALGKLSELKATQTHSTAWQDLARKKRRKKLLLSTRGQLSPSQESELLGEVLGGAI